MVDEQVKPHIVGFYADYEYRTNLNLVLESIVGSSLENMYQRDPPVATDMLSFWTSFFGVFKPLSKLHGMRYVEVPKTCSLSALSGFQG
jgi:hypothetical protein